MSRRRSVPERRCAELLRSDIRLQLQRFPALIANIADEEPPILGNETGSTSFNSGNTFPSLFDTMGRTYTANLKLSF